MGMYTIRNLDEKTKETIHTYAEEYKLNTAEALRRLIALALTHVQHTKKEKQYGSFFELYTQIKFKGGKNLSKDHDRVAYVL